MALSGSLTAGYWYADNGQSRGYALSWSATQSIANNQSTITWWVDTAGTYPYQVAERTLIVTLAGKTLINKSDRVMRSAGRVASGSFTVDHDAYGNKSISGSIQAAVYTSAINCSNSALFSLDKIPRAATITNAPNFNDEENPVITYSNPAGFTVNTWLEINPTNEHLCIRENIGNGGNYTYELTEEERKSLIKCCNKDTATIRFGMYTYNGSTLIGTHYVDRKFTIINGVPTLTPSVVDINDATIELTGNANILVRYFSDAQVDSGAQVYKEATIKTQYVLCGNQRINEGNGNIENVSSGSFIFSVTDNRDSTITQTVNAPIIEYVNLTCNLNANAPDGEGDMVFSVNGDCFVGSFGAVDNSIRVYYRYKTDSEDYGDWIEASNVTLNNNTYVASINLHGLDYQKRYTFQAKAVDELIDIESVERVVKAVPVFDWSENDFNFNVSVLIKGTMLLDLFYPVGSIYQSTEDFYPGDIMGGTWEQIKDVFLLAAGDKYEAGSTGGAATVTLTVSQIPSHNHAQYVTANTGGSATRCDYSSDVKGIAYEQGVNTSKTGGGQAHNNMPPYLVVYVWKRIA